MTKKLLYNLSFRISVLTLIFCSCNNNTQKASDITESTFQSPTETKDSNSQQTEIHSLPAPMQIANAIKATTVGYSETFLCPIKNTTTNTSTISKTLLLGIYAVDLGYANTYEQKQTSINYFSTSLKMADDLKIMDPIDPSIAKHYKENINNQDSLTFYTLSTFKKIHNNLLSNNRTDEAYLILTGSFIEGLYLSAMIYEKSEDKNLVNVIGQQKIFLESIMKLLPQYEDNPEIANLILQLGDLQKTYALVEITYNPSSEKNTREMLPISISDNTLKQIIKEITDIRNNIVTQKIIS